MRILVAAVFLLAPLAGCLDNSDSPNEGGPAVMAPFDPAGLNFAHPSFEYGVNQALFESPDGRLYDDQADGSRVWYKTPYQGTPGTLRTMAPIAQADVGGAAGIAVLGGLAFAGPRGEEGPLSIINVMDPTNPVILDQVEGVAVRDADTILFPNGRLIVITTQGGGNILATDVTNPTNGTLISNFDTPAGNHNIAVVPGSPIVYNTGRDIIDYSNPANPFVVGKAPGEGSCHDIAFHIDQAAGKIWGICAGYANTEIWDISDPIAPTMLASIDYPSIEKGLPIVGGQFDDAGVPQDPARVADPACDAASLGDGCVSAAHPSSFSHLAITNHDASVLIMGDETGGGGSNQCDFYIEGADGQTHSGPVGNLWFYDITDPNNPDLRGHVSPGQADAEGSCTAHFGKVIEDTGFLVMAFYSAGITLVDFRDLDNPRIVDRLDQAGSVWDVWFHQGYLFTGDMSRGVDVISLHGA